MPRPALASFDRSISLAGTNESGSGVTSSLNSCLCCEPIAGLARPGRRRFIAGAAAMGSLAAAGCTSIASGPTPRIDVHHHIVPPTWLAALNKAKLGDPILNDWTPQRSLDDMDAAGVTTSMTSPTIPALGFLGAKDAADIARSSNEYARKLVDDSKGRFRMFALLPMPHVDETLKEMAYALDVLKADGVAFMTSYGNQYLGDKAFAPVMDELNRRKATAYTHPNNPACCVNIASSVPPVIVEYGTDTSRTIASLIFSDTAKRCPDINFIFSHAGGTLTSLTDRFLVQIQRFPPYAKRGFTTERVLSEIRQFYYDTAQASNPILMGALSKLVPMSQILFGSDYPYRTATEHVAGLAKIFNASELRAIDYENSRRIMPALRTL